MFYTLRLWLQQLRNATFRKPQNKAPRRARLHVEALEDRLVPDSGGAAGVLAAATPTGVTYGGGPLVSTVSIHLIFLKDSATGNEIPAAQRTQFHSYFNTLTSDGFIPTLLTQYNAGSFVLGNGTIGADDIDVSATTDTTITDNATAGTDPSITDTNIQTIISNQISAGLTGSASGGANNIYFVFTPPGDATGDNSSNSVNDFLGYHSAINDPLSPSGLDYYAVIADQSLTLLGGQAGEFNNNSIGNGLNAFQGMTQTCSHEMVETITDANATTGWRDPTFTSDGGEIGDHAGNESYVQDGYNVQYMWSNTLNGPAHAPSTGANDLFINQVTPPAVTGVLSVPVATFTSANTSLTASQFHVAVQDGTSPYPFWTSPTVTGSNGHFVIRATPAAGTDTVGAHGSAFNQDGLYVIVSTSTLDFTNGAPSNAPISVRYAPYVVAAASAPFNYTADSGSGTNNFVLKKVGSNFQLTDNGLVVFTQPTAKTTSININADPAVAGDPSASINDSLTIDYSGGAFTNAVNFNGGPGSAAHTLTITGGTFPNESYAYTGTQSGTITIGGQVITYSNVTANADTTTVANLTINLPPSVQAMLQDDGASNNGVSEIVSSSNSFPLTAFGSPTASLTIATAGSGSQVQLKTMDPAFHPITEVFSSSSAGDVFQFVNAGAVADTTSVTLTTAELDVNGNSPTIDALNGNGLITNTAATSAILTVGTANSSGNFGGVIQNGVGSIALTKFGLGTETLSGANSYSGATTVAAGTLADGANNAVPTGSSLIVDGVFDLGGFDQQVANVTGSGTLTDSSATNLTTANSSADTFGGTITGSMNLIAAGTGTLTLTGSGNTYTGATTINAGATLAVGIANALPITTALSVAGTLDLSAFGQQVGSVTGAGTVTDSGAAANFSVANASTDTFAGTIASSTNLVAAGTSTLTLTSANTYTGTTTINSGATLADGIANTLPTGTSVADNGVFNLDGFAQQVTNVTGSGIVTNSAAAANFTVNNGAADIFGGALTGSLALTKTANGTLTLSGTSTATGAALVSAGVLQVTGSITANVTVANAATLDGTGSTGTVTVQSGGLLYPSTTVNTLSTGSLNLQAGSDFNVAVAGSSNYSKDTVTSGTVTLATTGGGVTLNLTSLAGFHPVAGDQYTIVNNNGSSAQPVTGTFLAGAGINGVPVGTVLTEGMILSTNFLNSGNLASITYQGGVNHKSVVIVVMTNGPLSYTGTSATNPNNFLVVEDGGNIDIYDNTVLVQQRLAQVTTSINIGVNAGLDATLTIDYSGGLFTNPVNFDGGTGNAITHTITLENDAFTNESYTYTNANTATVNLDGRVISVSHIASITDSLTVANLTFNLPTAAQAVLQDSGAANDGSSQLAPPSKFTRVAN